MMNRSCGATLSLCNFAVYLTLKEICGAAASRVFFPPGFFTPDGTQAHHHSSPEPQRGVVPGQDPPLTIDRF